MRRIAHSNVPGGSAGLVERSEQLKVLGEALAEVAGSSRGRVILVAGEAGIGKTALLRRFCAGVDGSARVLWAGCDPLFTPRPLGPVVDLAQVVGGELASCAANGARPWEVAAALPRELAAGPSVLVLEDVHWADEATLEFLAFVMSLPDQPVNVVATYRGEDLPADSLLLRMSSRLPAGRTQLRLTLRSLDVGQTAELMSSMLDGEHVSEQFAGLVHQRTDGVPLAVEESVRLLGEHGDLVRRHGTWVRHKLGRIVVPSTVREAVLERVARLSGEAQLVLQAAAVLSEPASEAVVAAVSGLPEQEQRAGVGEALRRGLLEERSGLVSFRHALAARAVYEMIAAPDRRVMHLRAARALEDEAPVASARLAGHFREGGAAGPWLHYAEEAADQALASGDPVSAAELLHGLLSDADLSARLLIRLIDKIPIGSLTGDRFHAVLNALRSRVDAGTAGQAEEGELRYQLGRLLSMTEHYDAGRGELEKAVPLLAHRPFYQASAMLLLGWPRGTTSRASVHHQWLQRATEVLAATTPEPGEQIAFLVDNATALLMLGEPEGWALADQLPEDASTWPERQVIARGHLNIGSMAMLWGRNAEARRRLTWAAQLADRYGYLRHGSMALAALTHLDYLTGAWAGLAERAASFVSDENLPEVARLDPLVVCGLLHAATGSPVLAEEQLQRVYDSARQRMEAYEGCEAAAGLARLRLAHGQVVQALEITDWSAEVVAAKETWLPATELAPARVAALVAAGDTDRAGDLVTAFAGWIRGRDAPASSAALTVCQATLAQALGDNGHAAALFGRAAVLWQALPRPYEAYLAQESQAHCLLADGQRDAGLAAAGEAFRELTGLGARPQADRVAALLREHGAGVPRVWRGGRRGYGQQLSPRETDVVRLLAAGQTRRQIAETLFRSPKTVDEQLRSAMRKLGVTSRTALAAIAVEADVTGGSEQADV
jgi:DNA-binding CsgD family transcriptional regulator